MSAIVNIVSDTWDYITEDLWDDILSYAGWTWNVFVRLPLEMVLGIIGIEDENVLFVDKSTTAVFESNSTKSIGYSGEKAVYSWMKNGGTYFDWYNAFASQYRSQFNGFYNYGKNNRYEYGYPDLEIRAGNTDSTAIKTALENEVGVPCTILQINTQVPSELEYILNWLQNPPYDYIPGKNSLTYTDEWYVSYSDWIYKTHLFDINKQRYSIEIERQAVRALVWIEGSTEIVEGDYGSYKIKCNRPIPAGKTLKVNIDYSGSADNTRYNKIPYVTFLAGETEKSFNLYTNSISSKEGNKSIILTIGIIENYNGIFEHVDKHTLNSITTTLIEKDSIVLTMNTVEIVESTGTALIPVKLQNAASGPFTVNYTLTDGTAASGIDFINNPVTLNFLGNSGEIQNIAVPIVTGDGNDDNEYFTISLNNSSDPNIDISNTARVFITDQSKSHYPAADTVPVKKYIYAPNFIRESSVVVRYYKDSETLSDWRYWIYRYSDNTYQNIDSDSSLFTGLEALPIVILKTDGNNVDSNKESSLYITTRTILNVIQLDLDTVMSNARQNPAYDTQVTDMFVNFAISPQQTDKIISKYLWEAFHFFIVEKGLYSTSNSYAAIIKEQTINNALAWNYHKYSASITGSITNDYEHLITVTSETSYNPDTGNDTTISVTNLFIRKKLTPTSYEQLHLKNLSSVSIIKKNGYWEAANYLVTDKKLTIPLSMSIIEKFTQEEMSELFMLSLRIDTYAGNVVHVEFYETENFIKLFEVVSVVITIITLGAASGPMEVMRQLLIQWAVSELVVYLAELTGNAAFAALVGLVATLALSGTGPDSFFSSESAESIINASTNFADNLVLASDQLMKELALDLKDLNSAAEARLNEFKDKMPDNGPLTAQFMVALNGVDTTMYPARDAQYNFDLMFNYDTLIHNYHKLALTTGITS